MQANTVNKDQVAELVLKKGITQEQAAALTGCTQGRISQIIKEFSDNPEYIGFKEKKDSLLEHLQARIYKNVNDCDIQKASLQQKIISMSVLQDKIEQIRGVSQSLSDNQINVLISNVINNYVVDNTTQPDIIEVEDIPSEIVNNLNEL
jgi:transcriptional regulator with XRE-family HTH domain